MILRISAHIFKSALPWNFKLYVWVLGFIWVSLGVLFNYQDARIPLYGIIIPALVYAIGAMLILNIFATATFRFSKILTLLGAIFFTLFSPLSPFVGFILVAGPYFAANEIYGEATNPPYSDCEKLPHKNELSNAVKSGFDVNGKCCLDTMIGSCLVITPTNRNFPNIDAVTNSPQFSDEEVLSYLESGAKPTINSLSNAARFRSKEVVQKFLIEDYSVEDFSKAYVESFVENKKVSPLIKEYALKRFNEKSFRDLLKKEVSSRLNNGYNGIHYQDPNITVEPFRELAKEELLLSEEEIQSALFCSILDAQRIQSSETKYDKALTTLMASPNTGNYQCISSGLPNGESLLRRAYSRAINCQGSNCEVYRSIIKYFLKSGAVLYPTSSNYQFNQDNCDKVQGDKISCKMMNRIYQLQLLQMQGMLKPGLPVTIDNEAVDPNNPLEGF